MTDFQSWACTYIAAVDPSFASLGDQDKLTENLFDSGRLDSMGLMNFLFEIESTFSIIFTAESFQDRRIQTVLGLSEVVLELQ